MLVYNSQTRRKEELVPVVPGQVSMYVCGPTVYDQIHIGNGRTFLAFDVIRRYLAYKGYQVRFAQNLTDVDDKIINRANEEGITAKAVADKYIDAYFDDTAALGVERATHHPRVSEHMDEIIDLIARLIENGKAYEKDGNVFYAVSHFPEYGKLSGQSIEDLQSGARISVDEDKNDPLDFALWKKKKEGEPYWESPWGDGRPGWHIECSAMSTALLGETIDIHGGGQDLIFPHHENEIAQSEGACGCTFCNYWMHNGFINVDKEKMSKSKGNFFTVRDIRAQYDPQVIRLFMLMAQYRSPLNFSRELIEQAENALERITNARTNLNYLAEHAEDRPASPEEQAWVEKINGYKDQFIAAMDDDLNTADALSAVFELIRESNSALSEASAKESVRAAKDLFDELTGVLNIGWVETEDLESEVEALIEARQQARKNKDYALADKIRDDLAARGIELMDTREGVKWKKI